MCLHKFGARDSWLNNWEHWGEDMYCPRALLKILGSGTTFFFCVKDRPAPRHRGLAPPEGTGGNGPLRACECIIWHGRPLCRAVGDAFVLYSRRKIGPQIQIQIPIPLLTPRMIRLPGPLCSIETHTNTSCSLRSLKRRARVHR